MAFTIIPSAIRDPFEFYKRLRLTRSHTCILESLGDVEQGFSRYTFIGALPGEILCKACDETSLSNVRHGSSVRVGSWLEIVDTWSALGSATLVDPNPIQAGVIGYIGYDARYEFERLQRRIEMDVPMPDLYLVRYDAILVHDRNTGEAHWAVNHGFEHQCRELEQLATKSGLNAAVPFALRSSIAQDFSTESYLESVLKTTDYIRAGDIFQANITGRFHADCEGDVIDLYERLRQITPNPFFALLDFPQPVISTSPERFFSVRAGLIQASPIKGTVECALNAIDQRSVLERSEKDRAENVMITDLMRNDIGRVCVKDSVRVGSLCEVKRFNDLYHLESTVSGTLKPTTQLSDLLRSVFPCGSITGAPKIRAMDIIEELEFVRRGPYTGAIGFFGCDGWIDTSVAIRIAYFHSGRVFFHAGGGIVADSNPEAEYHELLAKTTGLRRAIESFEVRE